jgi:hypothetical protein
MEFRGLDRSDTGSGQGYLYVGTYIRTPYGVRSIPYLPTPPSLRP